MLTQFITVFANFLGYNRMIKMIFPLIAWDKICRPKIKVDLRLEISLPLNKSFAAKLGCAILSEPNIFWPTIIGEKYLSTTNFFEYLPNPKRFPNVEENSSKKINSS